MVTTPELHKRVKPYLRRFGPRFLGWATHYYLPMGKKVVVIGAGLHGMEVAEYLAKRGRKVTIVEPTDVIGEGVIDFRLGLTMDWFAQKGVTHHHRGQEHQGHRARAWPSRTRTAAKHELEADTVMPTAPLMPNDELYKALEGKVPELYLIGDGKEAGMIVHAVRSGYQTAKRALSGTSRDTSKENDEHDRAAEATKNCSSALEKTERNAQIARD